MSASVVRPLGVGEILDAGMKTYLQNAATLVRLTAVVVIPAQVLSAVVLLSTVSNANDIPHGGFALTSLSGGDRAASVGASAVLNFTSFIVGLLTTGVCVKAVSDAYLGHAPTFAGSLRFVARRLLSLAWLSILAIVVLIVAFVLLIIPGIWLYAAIAVATPALLVEGLKGRRALRRSIRLVRHRWWATAGLLLATNLIVGVVAGALQSALVAISIVGDRSSVLLAVIVISLAGAVSLIVTRPFTAAVTVMLYYDLRVRREGYDVELLAQQLGLSGFDAAAEPSPPRDRTSAEDAFGADA